MSQDTKKSLVYTRTGDHGETSLVGGRRALKDDLRLETYGTVDELNSNLGLLGSVAKTIDPVGGEWIEGVQSRLFDLGAYLANPAAEALKGISLHDIELMEADIDRFDSQLPELHSFILPGGISGASVAHICRTVCRRTERRVISLGRTATIDPLAVAYLNRLSDLLFVYARRLNSLKGAPDIPWTPVN